jgi:hypothetical protein
LPVSNDGGLAINLSGSAKKSYNGTPTAVVMLSLGQVIETAPDSLSPLESYATAQLGFVPMHCSFIRQNSPIPNNENELPLIDNLLCEDG